MRVMLLTEDRKTARAYADAAEQGEGLRLCALKTVAQVLERLFRDPFDALLSDDAAILLPEIRKSPVLWPEHTFLLIDSPIVTELPDLLTFCFSKDSDPRAVLARIGTFPKTGTYKFDTESMISRFLLRAGVPVSMSGFDYLRIALRLMLEKNDLLEGTVNDIYDVLAMLSGVSASIAEHAIRQAIDAAWMRADTSALEKLFGYTVRSDRGAPSVAAFLFRAADHIRLTKEGRDI